MKPLSLLILLALLGCKKESDLQIGQFYNLKSKRFNENQKRPLCPCRLDRLYTNGLGEPFSIMNGRTTGNNPVIKYLRPDGTVIDSTWNPNKYYDWEVPQGDIER